MKDPKEAKIKNAFATGLKNALKERKKKPEDAAVLLGVELGTLYKYLKGDMIPGGQVLWRACTHFGMVLDEKGFRISKKKARPTTPEDDAQYAFPFINESVENEKIRAEVRRSNQSDYVQVSLRIKVAS